jgi:hypothetical protein
MTNNNNNNNNEWAMVYNILDPSDNKCNFM